MNIYPKTHASFLSWSESIAYKMEQQSKGKLRIGKNKLAAIMAAELPDTGSDFNINTLKAMFENTTSHQNTKTEVDNSGDKSSYQAFLKCLKIDMRHCIYEYSTKIADLIVNGKCGESLYDILNHDGELCDLYDGFHEITDETFKLANHVLPDLDRDRLNDAYANFVPLQPNSTFSYIQYKTVGFAYREFLKDTLYTFLDDLAFAYDDMLEPRNMSREQFSRWISASLDAWKGDQQFNPPVNYRGFQVALNDVLGQQKAEYRVVVRAIVEGDDALLSDYDIPENWECYDYDVHDGNTILRLSTVIMTTATDIDEAISNSHRDAPALNLRSDQASVKIWVDKDLPGDIEKTRLLPRI